MNREQPSRSQRVKPAASTKRQWESRAAHITAKAKLSARVTPDDKALKRLPGVWGVTGLDGGMRNWRDPVKQPESGRVVSYKPEVKSSDACRESEGVIVLSMGTQENVSGGKGLCGRRDGEEGKREGMVAKRPNHPAACRCSDKVRQLRNRLWIAAKRDEDRRFHALYDRIYRSDVLWEAWKRVRANRGAAGVDKETIAAVEEYGVARLIDELQSTLRAGAYRPLAVLRRYIPKPDGRKRPLGIPSVRDRIVQMATKLIVEPIFEADFKNSSYGYRPKRNATQALEAIRVLVNAGNNHVLDADIRDFFGSIDFRILMERMGQRISDRRVLKLVGQWLRAGVLENGTLHRTEEGVPQGGVISPLLSNIYLGELDKRMASEPTMGTLVRYCDDFVVVCKSREQCEQTKAKVQNVLGGLKLELHPEKTRMVELTDGKEGFDFLGCHLHKRVSGAILQRSGRRCYYLHRWPSQRSGKRLRTRIGELTDAAKNAGRDIVEVIKAVNPVLRGWGNYFHTGNATQTFITMDNYVWRRLLRIKVRKHGRNLRPDKVRQWTPEYFHKLGLYRLRGTVRYPQPGKVYQESLPVSRVRENRKHGLKGSFTEILEIEGK
jgi:RNA-directed DNA polymerase